MAGAIDKIIIMQIKVGVIQENPVFFNKKETINKIEDLLSLYSKDKYQLLVFPESFIPGYPRGFSFGAKVGSRTEEGRKLYAEYHKNSIQKDSEDLKKLEKLSKKYKVYLVMGVTEKSDDNGSLYCSMLYISPTKGLLGIHRKIKPTGTERVIWDEASGKDQRRHRSTERRSVW